MIRDISDVAHNVKHVTKHNAEIIASDIPGWTGTNSGTLLTPIANTTLLSNIQGILLENTIIKGTDNSGLTIGDADNMARTKYSIALGKGADASGTAGFMYRDRIGNTFVFDSGGCKDGGRLLINGHPVGAHDAHFSVSGDLLVHGTIESSGVVLQPIHSAEGSTQSAVTDLDPSTNPLMTKGMLWINEAQEERAWTSCPVPCWTYGQPISDGISSPATAGAEPDTILGGISGKIYAIGAESRASPGEQGAPSPARPCL